MGIYGGLAPEDWRRWGQFTTVKTNAPELVTKESTAEQVIYCSPLVDPYQPAEREQPYMPNLLAAMIQRPPRVFVIQTRGTGILRDVALLQQLTRVTKLRISFSITTDRDDVRRRYEPHCEPNEERLAAITSLRSAGLEVFATLAPLLPCNPERLAELAIAASGRDLIGDPLHTRDTKKRGATTREAAFQIAQKGGDGEWFEASFQDGVVKRIQEYGARSGFTFTAGPEGFGKLARP